MPKMLSLLIKNFKEGQGDQDYRRMQALANLGVEAIKEKFYEDLAIQIENSMMNNTVPIILGDLNAKLQKTNDKITSYRPGPNLEPTSAILRG